MYKAEIKYDYKNNTVEQVGFHPEFTGKSEVIMAIGNGYLGMRSANEESSIKQIRNLFINGTFNKSTDDEVTELPNLADSTSMDIFVDGERVMLQENNFSDYKKSLNVKTGLVSREYVYKTKSGKEIKFQFKRFASFENVNNLCYELEATEKNGKEFKISVTNKIDGQKTNSGAMHLTDGEKRVYDYKTLELVQTTTESKITIFHRLTATGKVDGKEIKKENKKIFLDRRIVGMTFDVVVKDKLVVNKYVTVNTTIDYNKKELDLEKLAAPKYFEEARENNAKIHETLVKNGFAKEFKASVAAMERDVWSKGKIKINSSNEYDQLAIDFARYHLAVFTPRHDIRLGIGAKGLSGEGYKGHSFWDTEMFITPLYNAINPEQARKLLEYRYLGLTGARRKAAENKYKGAMYPWEAAWPTDGEVTPVWGGVDIVTGKSTKIWSGFIEQHIIADIAFMTYQYFNYTNDTEFMNKYGYEMLIDTAIFWTSRVVKTNKGYEIKEVIGPNEYKEHVDNNSFTNYMAKWNIDLVIDFIENRKNATIEKLAKKLGLTSTVLNKMKDISKNIFLNKPNKEGIIGENDTYLSLPDIPNMAKYKNQENVGSMFHDYNLEQVNKMQVSKQADLVILMLLLEGEFNKELKEKNFHYYEQRTTHDSSLSLSSHAILAADLKEKLAYELFTKSTQIDLGENLKTSDHGIHAASIAGMVQIALFGFGGVRIVNNKLRIEPNLPKEWKSISFEMEFQGNTLELDVKQNSLVVSNKGSKKIEFTNNGETFKVPANEKIKIDLR